MKIRIIVRFDDHERQFFVACGTGEKTFKWLANVASQRYAMAVPNGNLRRREDYCALSDAAQFQTFNMILPSGETPSPMELLTEHLHDEDSVIIELCSRLPVDGKTGTPKQTQFATLAYSTSQEKLGYDPEEFASEDGSRAGFLSRVESADQFSKTSSPTFRTGSSTVTETPAQLLSKANFIRVMMKSQTLNEEKIHDHLDHHWKIIHAIMPLLKTREIPHIKQTFFHHWDLLIDIYEYYSSNNPNHHSQQVSANSTKTMIDNLSFTKHYYEEITATYFLEKHDFINLLEDANVFPAIQLQAQANLIFNKTCQLLTQYSQQHHFTQQPVNALNFTGFLLSLLFCSQLKYNDTLDAKAIATHAYDSIDRLILQNFTLLARHLNCRALLKQEFFTKEVLSKVKDHYEILQSNFDKIASKSKDVPVTITLEDVLELLYNSTLLPKKDDLDFVKVLLVEIRKGTIFGREIDNVTSESMQTLLLQQQQARQKKMNFYQSKSPNETPTTEEDELYPSNEFTFAEFLEAIARAGYYYYTKTTPLNPVITQPILNLATGMMMEDPREIEKINIQDYLIRGVQDVSDFLTGKKLKPQQASSKKAKKGAATSHTNTASAEAK